MHSNIYNGVVIKYGGKTDHGGKGIPRKVAENLDWGFQMLTNTAANGARVLLGKRGGHRLLINKFIESIRNGTELPVTAEAAIENLRLLEEITSRMG